MTARIGIIGYPLGHSVSPAFQNVALRYLGLDMVYERWETPPAELAARVQGLRQPGFLGANVTVPYKEEVLALLDEVDAMAGRIGAVNTVVNRAGRLLGYNTDAPGFLRSLREEAGFDPAGRGVLIVGAGGAARAVAFALADAGASGIVFLNRTLDHAERLAEAIRNATGVWTQAFPFPAPGEPLTVYPPDLLVHCTTVGMRGGPAEGRAPDVGRFISPLTLVCDLVYNPLETPLLRLARDRGASVLGGLGMLVYQGAASFHLWTGQEPPLRVMYEAARRPLAAVAS
ncbi:MAG: shikimate dehydrogenase [Chloroflexi bacterium]|nr:shikimate dehydrogenase [Chloroflexota bacterium]